MVSRKGLEPLKVGCRQGWGRWSVTAHSSANVCHLCFCQSRAFNSKNITSLCRSRKKGQRFVPNFAAKCWPLNERFDLGEVHEPCLLNHIFLFICLRGSQLLAGVLEVHCFWPNPAGKEGLLCAAAVFLNHWGIN